ncbi:hypothetical protein BGZ57DRAFT_887356 [Hyaloscypha finlandica]|nr:hypothetical protein BGZ57DRAFT_887356 [Hyaloscypha finlandica]
MSGSSSPTAKLGLRERLRRKFGNRGPSPPSSTPPPIPVLELPTAHSPSSSSTQAVSASPLSASPFTVHSPNTTTALSPSQQPIPNLSFDLFEEALKLLSDGDRTIIRKYTLPTAGEIDLALVQGIAAAKVKQRRCIERRWTFTFAGREVTLKDKADKVVHWLNRFKSVGDIVVNVDPMHAGLPWAGIRLLLEVAVSEANQMTSLLVGCETALYMANRLKAYTSFLQGLPATLSRTNFETHLTELYAHIFRFLVQALQIYETSTFERAFKAFWNVSNVQDFEKSCNELGQKLEIEASNCDRTLSAQDRTRVGELKTDLRNVLEGLEQFHKIQDSLDRIEMNYCLNNLRYAQGAMFNSYGNTRTTCHPKTRVDLLRRIQSWAQEPESKHIFWLNGMAGVGKSTISQTFAKWLTEQDDLQALDLGASFFFKRNEGDRGSALRFFPTIVRQLVVKLPGLDTLVADVIKHDPLIFDKSLGEQFNKLLREPLQKINSSNGGCLTLVLVVDALDECGSKSTPSSSDIEVLLRLWSQLSQPETVRLKLFLTSRPNLPTQLGFKEMSIDDYQDMVLHSEKEVPPATIRHDILAFLNDEFSKIRKKYNTRLRSGAPLEDTWPSDNVLQELVDMAIPLFIVAATVCIYVGDFRRHSPGKRLERILGFQKQGQLAQLQQLRQTYLPVLTQQEGTFSHADEENEYYENFRRIVGSIVVLAEPLSIASLADLLGLEQDDISRCLADLRSVLHIPDDSEIPVRTLHLSFSEFLLSDELRDQPFGVDGPATHQLLSNKCLELLSQPSGLRKSICNLTYEGQPRSEVDSTVVNQHLSPALQYACKYWVHHAQPSKTPIRDNDQVHEFLKKHFLNWLEALSLMGRITEAIGHTCVLQSLTAVSRLSRKRFEEVYL